MIESKKEHLALDLPDAKIDNITFQYNFFTKDERTNDSGVPQIKGQPQSVFSNTLLKREVPRFIKVDFSIEDFDRGNLSVNFAGRGNNINFQPFRYEGIYTDNPISISQNRDYIQNENDVTSAFDEPINYKDSILRERLKCKADLLTSLIGEKPGTRQGIKAVADLLIPENQESISDLNATISSPEATFVNDVGTEFKNLKFSKAADLKLKMHMDKSLIEKIVYSDLRSSDFKLEALRTVAEDIKNSSDSRITNGQYVERSTIEDLESTQIRNLRGQLAHDKAPLPRLVKLAPTLTSELSNFSGPKVSRVDLHVVGYIVRRKENLNNTSKQSSRIFYLDGSAINSFTDTEIVYGKRYFYEVAPVFKITYVNFQIADFGRETVRTRTEEYLVSGDFSGQVHVKCIEKVPPRHPEVLFFHYDYGKSPGLMIDWRMPKSEQRDIKYFQVFRRKSIYEPFTCIGMIDFDDSEIKTVKMERVRKDKILKYLNPKTFFKDFEFNRASSYIYAIASVDAHGLTSNYSSQTQVTFRPSENDITVKRISKSGAPKQYPNFFIDPEMDDDVRVNSLTQDVALSSGKKKIKIYFDPDCRYLTKGFRLGGSDLSSQVEEIIKTKNFPAFYKIHMINIDREKSADFEIRFEDVRENRSVI